MLLPLLLIPFLYWLLGLDSLTQWGRNYAAEVVAKEKLKFFALWEAEEKALTSNTAIGSKVFNMTGSKAAGWTNGTIVWFTALTGSVTGVVAKRPYEIAGELANSFELTEVGGATAIEVTGHELETASTKIERLKAEVTVARGKTAFKAGAKDVSEDLEVIVKVQAGKSVQFAVWYEVETLATGKAYAVERLTEKETFGAEGEYKLTSDKLEAPVTVA